MKFFLPIIISMVIGTTVVVNGIVVKSEDILNNAEAVVEQANIHQLATVLEIYYLDYDKYPGVAGGEALINTLKEGGYIRNQPLNPSAYEYQSIRNGQDFILKIAD